MPPRDRLDLRRRLLSVAARQSGYFTAAQAREAGYAYPSQKYNSDRGNWIRVDRGLYRLPAWPAGAHDDLVRWTLWSRGRGVISHQTALSVHGLGDFNPARVHMTVPPNFRPTAPGVVLHRGELEDADTREHEGFRLTSPARSLLDVAAAEADPALIEGAVRDALSEGLITRRDLLQRADEYGPAAALAIERSLSARTP